MQIAANYRQMIDVYADAAASAREHSAHAAPRREMTATASADPLALTPARPEDQVLFCSAQPAT